MTTLFISHSSKDKQWAEQMREALRGQGYQSLFLDDGIHAGADWEQALYRGLRQCRGVVVLCTAHWLASPWCVAEAIMARERGKRLFLLATPEVTDGRQAKGSPDGAAAPQLPDFLKDTQFISLADVTEGDACERLWCGLAAEGLKDDFPLPRRPYPGLEPFQEIDAAVFFGRDEEIERVIGVLNKRRHNNAEGFILILGASGCGKSSLVRAGVLPRLKRSSDEVGAGGRWVIPPPFMAGRGLEGLAHSLARAFEEAAQPRDLAFVRQQLEAASGLCLLASELLFARGVHEGYLVLILDQLEEVFGTLEGSKARAALRLLLEASADAASPVVTLATMRSDFLNAFQLFPGAAERYEKLTLDPMLRPHFSGVIEGPADRFGLDLEAGLTVRLVEETAYNDALPLLAFTLEKLYESCKAQGRLTIKAYQELGGVSAAIKHAANVILRDEKYAGLSAEDSRMRDLRRAFYSLAQVGEKDQFTRRTARWSQMPASCKNVLQRFVKDRLLVSGKNGNDQPILSVAHEALFRVWDTLDGWLRADRKALALRSQIEEAAAQWIAANRAESRTWSEERVLEAVQAIEGGGVSLSDVTDKATVDAFLGPTARKDLESLPALSAAEDATVGSGRYGSAWRLPLGHEARASVGVRLAILGDRRTGVGLRADGLPDIDWRPVKGGEATIEVPANPDDPNSRVVKRLTCAVAPFWMARYPVTLAQFRVFFRECHRENGYHLPPGFKYKLPSGYPPPRHGTRYDNYPVDGVNWYDSVAFCHWLSTRLGLEVRLPTEYEWQRAATGGDLKQVYPWGPAWDPQKEPWRANTLEGDLGHATAVGMYPAGASPEDVLDMVGTLWEWCQNSFNDPNDASFATSEENPRALRGGSWYSNQDLSCSYGRIWDLPKYRNNTIGFRVVCLSPSLDTDR